VKLTPGAGVVVDGEEEQVADLLAVVGETVAVSVTKCERNFCGKVVLRISIKLPLVLT
jgi:hypothetical protein